METVYGQTLSLWLGNEDEHCALESDTTGLNVKENLYLSLPINESLLRFLVCINMVGHYMPENPSRDSSTATERPL